jgi:hypothetical protein
LIALRTLKPSYDAIKEEVVESVPEVTTVESAIEPNDVPTVPPATDEGFETVKSKNKKPAVMATCEYCSKSMTQKSLKYTHCVICPKRPGIETINCVGEVNEVQNEAPPKPKLQRSVTVVEDHEPVKAKAKAKPRTKKTATVEEAETPTLPEPPKRRSKGVERVMKYESMVANAL